MATNERIIIESMFKIVDKNQLTVPFKLNAAQRSIDMSVTGRDVIPKARQRGVSSYFLGRWTAKCLHQDNVRAVVISHEKEATERMLAKVHFILDNLEGLPAVLENSSKSEITFPKTNSMFYIGTAGQRAFGRGDTITHLHCSEVAYWPDVARLTAGLFQAVPGSGEIAIESTGNGQGNWYHNLCVRAQSGKSRYRLHFLPWHTDPDYRLNCSPEEGASVMEGLLEELEEPQLVQQFGLTPDRLLWRRLTLEDFDYDLHKFKQEYPMTLDECFQSSGHSVFQHVVYVETKDWEKLDSFLFKLAGHPRQGGHYSLGVDVAAGVGKDRSVIQVIDLDRLEQVTEWVSDRTDPHALAQHISNLGKLFNLATVTVESNNHGLVTLKALSGLYPYHLIHRTPAASKKSDEIGRLVDLGVRTTARTKPYIVGKCKKMLLEGFIVHSYPLKAELDSFVEHEDGSLGASEGCHDDRVIALAVCLYNYERSVLASVAQTRKGTGKPEPDPFSLEAIELELRSRGFEYPFRQQVGDATYTDVS